MTFDHLLKIVFRINIWICNNKQAFFTESQKVTLLKLSITNLNLITRNASPKAFLEIMSDKSAAQDFLWELICLDDKELMELQAKLLMPMLDRLQNDLKNGAKDVAPETIADLKQTFVAILERSQEILQYTFECLVSAELNQLE